MKGRNLSNGKILYCCFRCIDGHLRSGPPVAAYRITLVGEVNDNNQIVADNEKYEVDNNAVGDDLVVNHIAQKVKVVGILKHTRKFKIISVESFEVVDK